MLNVMMVMVMKDAVVTREKMLLEMIMSVKREEKKKIKGDEF